MLTRLSIKAAQAAHLSGATVLFRFPHWPAPDKSRPVNWANESTPIRLYRKYVRQTKWPDVGLPTFYVDTE